MKMDSNLSFFSQNEYFEQDLFNFWQVFTYDNFIQDSSGKFICKFNKSQLTSPYFYYGIEYGYLSNALETKNINIENVDFVYEEDNVLFDKNELIAVYNNINKLKEATDKQLLFKTIVSIGQKTYGINKENKIKQTISTFHTFDEVCLHIL